MVLQLKLWKHFAINPGAGDGEQIPFSLVSFSLPSQ